MNKPDQQLNGVTIAETMALRANPDQDIPITLTREEWDVLLTRTDEQTHNMILRQLKAFDKKQFAAQGLATAERT